MSKDLGKFEMSPSRRFRACAYEIIKFRLVVGRMGLDVGGKLKIGFPNMGWGEPLTPYPRKWPEKFKGRERVICNWKKCNTTYKIISKGKADLFLSHRESQAGVGQDPTWTWWITRSEERRVGKECRSRWSP